MTRPTVPSLPLPRAALVGARAYRAWPARERCDLLLDANEGPEPPAEWLLAAAKATDEARRYPAAGPLEQRLAERFNISHDRVLVSAGGDDTLDRCCRAFLEPGRKIVLARPTFEMIERYATLAGGEIDAAPWTIGEPYPEAEVLSRIDEHTGVVAIVSPNNPTGATVPNETVRGLIDRAAEVGALVVADLAYAEFDENDPTAEWLEHPNVVVVRTFSKAWGLAGARVGYALGDAAVIEWLRAAGGPFTVSTLSLAVAAEALERGDRVMTETVAQVTRSRTHLTEVLERVGARPVPSAANFVLARLRDADQAAWFVGAMASLGIAVRGYPASNELAHAVRITCPTAAADTDRVVRTIATAMRPEAILFDLDGVIADVSRSYRKAILDTAATFGATISPDEVAEAKAAGDANNDWVLTLRLLANRGVTTSLEEVTRRFEVIYQGTDQSPGLHATETLLCTRDTLEQLARRLPLAVVTGRPRRDAERFLTQHGLTDLFQTLVCMEEGPPKPDPTPVRIAMERLGLSRACASKAWMIGDTPDDIRAAAATGVVPIGIPAPGEDTAAAVRTLETVGAARVIRDLTELQGLLP
ncbi:MAG: TIGR01548 family HAD-type hydrolase [Planctomycetota bacterium]